MRRFIFGESRWPRGGAKGDGCHPLKIQLHPIFDEIWAIYLNLQEKNNEIGRNSAISEFGDIWTMYVNFPKISNETNQNDVGDHVRELQIFPILVKFGPSL